MKFTDDRLAKIRLWVQNPQVTPDHRIVNLPRFMPQRFSSYEELHAWKRKLLIELARRGGAQWSN